MKDNLTSRNHELDHLFESERLILKEKKKKSDDSSDTDTEDDEPITDDGYIYVEKDGVSDFDSTRETFWAIFGAFETKLIFYTSLHSDRL